MLAIVIPWLVAATASAAPAGAQTPLPPLVFVQRQIPDQGTLYWPPARDMPGVGPRSRFRVAAPGRLVKLFAPGVPVVLVDGAQPTPASLELIDVNAPAVSYDGQWIAFAGLPAGSYSPDPVQNPGAWRIFAIRSDGTGLRQVTFSDQNLDLSQFGPAAPLLEPYDDTDPVFLPDGRLVFASTRWPCFSHYGKHFPAGVRTTNLHVVDFDGANLRRITSGHHGADRPLVDPLTGKLVFFRWWFNFRTATHRMSTIPDPGGGYWMHDGLTNNRKFEIGEPKFISKNSWHAATVDPDGTDLGIWTSFFRERELTHAYGGAFTPEGDLIANFFPMFNMTEAAGFGGLRRHPRGAGLYAPIAGITDLGGSLVNPYTVGIYQGKFYGEPDVLPDGRIVASRAPDMQQDYGLVLMDPDGSNVQPLYDVPGTSELRARWLIPRPLPPILPDRVAQAPSLLPPVEGGNYAQDGTFVFDALNVYFNAPVDVDVVSAPAVGSAARIRFFLDMQRTAPGSLASLDWPILLEERAVAPDGSVRKPNAPANVPLFEQLRDPTNLVPFTGGPQRIGAAHVTGLNFGRPGQVASCIGCHAGHTLIRVPPNRAAALWTNLAPGAAVRASSSRTAGLESAVVDRRAAKGTVEEGWTSALGQAQQAWLELDFAVPVTVRSVRLWGPRQGGAPGSSLQVAKATVRLFVDHAGKLEAGNAASGPVALGGTDVVFPDVLARMVRVELDQVAGTWSGKRAAGLAEVEVIARGEAGP